MKMGLEYILNLFNMQHIELADKLGIKKQNINLWIRGKQNIPKKYLPMLSEMFGIEEEYFRKELSKADEIEVLKQKLIYEMNSKEIGNELQFNIIEQDLVETPKFDNEEVNRLGLKKQGARLMEGYQELIDRIDDDYYLLVMEQNLKLLRIMLQEKEEHIIPDTIDALSHYYSIVPDWVGNSENDEFVSKLTDLFSHYDTNKKSTRGGNDS